VESHRLRLRWQEVHPRRNEPAVSSPSTQAQGNSASSFFIDTNVFVYAHDHYEPKKSIVARELIAHAFASGQGLISDQVVREFCNIAANKFKSVMTIQDVIAALNIELRPLVAVPLVDNLYESALKLQHRYSLSFYDACIVQSALNARCAVIYSEDMQDGAAYDGATIINPFKPTIK
jgi:predicted nucleic acid-binding protein